MLLTKKLIHLIKFIKIVENQIISNNKFFYGIIQNKYLLLSFSSYFNNKHYFSKKISPNYGYKIKLVTLSKEFFYNRTLELISFLNLIYVKFDLKFNSIKSKARKYTLLRSPFVYKKSREQFMFIKNISLVSLKLHEKNIFIVEYLDTFFKKIWQPGSVKLVISKIISV